MKDSLGDRMKEYENTTRYYLPRRAYTLFRIDGRAFHSYTKKCLISPHKLERPYDQKFSEVMNEVARLLLHNIQGAKIAYVQSDEISILVSDFDSIQTESWFGNNLQKMCSISAALATGYFNKLFRSYFGTISNSEELAFFDSRIWQVSDPWEVYNTFLWRQKDCKRNAILGAGMAEYSHKQLHGMNTKEIVDYLELNGHKSFYKYPIEFRLGRFIFDKNVESFDLDTKEGREKLQSYIPLMTGWNNEVNNS